MDIVNKATRSRMMAEIRGKNTKPEMLVRRTAHALGYRFRLHRRDLPGSPDLVFPRLRKIVLVHGCFWHQHSDPVCRNAVMPKTRREWWQRKLAENTARDERIITLLRAAGWDVLVIWECEVRSGSFAAKLSNFLRQPAPGQRPDNCLHNRRCDAVPK
jgi:DNA mismatch endonuclease (patch repair protein)